MMLLISNPTLGPEIFCRASEPRIAFFPRSTVVGPFSNPSTENFKWDAATKDSPAQNLRFRPEPVMEKTMFEKSYKFWKAMDSYDYNIVTGRTRVGRHAGTVKSEL